MKNTLFVVVNVLVFVAALLGLGYWEGTRSEARSLGVSTVMHRDIAITNMTLTSELATEIFFDQLVVDTSTVNAKSVAQSLAPWEEFIERYSKEYHVDADLVRAIIYTESKGVPFLTSRRGAVGLMQIMPATAAFVGVTNPEDPEQNIKAGVLYLAWLRKSQKLTEATDILWVWNAGSLHYDRRHVPGETQRFIEKTLAVKSVLKRKATPAG